MCQKVLRVSHLAATVVYTVHSTSHTTARILQTVTCLAYNSAEHIVLRKGFRGWCMPWLKPRKSLRLSTCNRASYNKLARTLLLKVNLPNGILVVAGSHRTDDYQVVIQTSQMFSMCLASLTIWRLTIPDFVL